MLPTLVAVINATRSYHVTIPNASAPSFQPKSMNTLVFVISLITPQIGSPSCSSFELSKLSTLPTLSKLSGLASRIRFSSLLISISFTSIVGLVASSNHESVFAGLNGSSASRPNTLIAIPSLTNPTILPLTQAFEACASAASDHASSVSRWRLEASVSPLLEFKLSM